MAQPTKGSARGTEAIQAAQEDQEQRQWTKIVAVVVVAVVVVAALGFGGYQLFIHPTWAQVLRDIFIILMAVQSLAIGILLIVLIVQIINLTQLLRDEVLPILNSTNETVDTVKQTTTFVSDVVVSPLIKAVSTVSAVQGGLKAIFRRRRPRSGSES
jgi:magnesium-transporting ATPase (P-type)